MWVDEGDGFERLINDFGPTSVVRPKGAEPTLEVSSRVASLPRRRREHARLTRALAALGAAAALSVAAIAVTVVASGADDRFAGSAQERLAGELGDVPVMMHRSGALVDLASLDHDGAATTAPVPSSSPSGSVPMRPPAADGSPVGQIVIPAAGVDAVFVAGVGVEELKLGPGWMPGTAMPGEPGNSVISGHRTTYGGPFRGLGDVSVGDEIAVLVPGWETLTFQVRAVFSVDPDQVQVTFPTGGVRLTLTTCHPEGSSAERLIVQAELISGPNVSTALSPQQWEPQR